MFRVRIEPLPAILQRTPTCRRNPQRRNLFGELFEFYKKTMILLRGLSLPDEKLNVVVNRIKSLLNTATVELKQAQQLNMTERLAMAYEEVKRLVEQLSGGERG